MTNQIIQYLSNNPDYFAGVIFFFGLMFGSFFNVVIYRVPVMMHLEWLEPLWLGEPPIFFFGTRRLF